MFMNSKVHNLKGRSYTTKITQTRRDYIEEVSCCVCRVFHDDSELTWADPINGDLDAYDTVPFCQSCYDAEFGFAYLKAA